MQLSNSVALITGASSGIGQAVARDLSAAGVRLVLTARRAQRLRELAGECPHCLPVPGDITDPDLPQKLIDAALDRFGRLDIVFNNAGIMETGTVEQIDLERVCRMVRTNVEATFRLAYLACRHFKKMGRGHLITTSSILGTKVRPTAGAYAGTKHAIEALTEALRMELGGSGVKVCTIEPGVVETELQANWPVPPKIALNIPHPLQPQDIARIVRFILEQPDHVNLPRLMATPSEQQM